jgi:hypothetical protein
MQLVDIMTKTMHQVCLCLASLLLDGIPNTQQNIPIILTSDGWDIHPDAVRWFPVGAIDSEIKFPLCRRCIH